MIWGTEHDPGQVLRGILLSFSLRNIQSENDKWHKISKLILEKKDIDVNAHWKQSDHTTLSYLCSTKSKSTIGVRILLEDSRTCVNVGENNPLYEALSKIEYHDDYWIKS